jgi:hypothetical protein
MVTMMIMIMMMIISPCGQLWPVDVFRVRDVFITTVCVFT